MVSDSREAGDEGDRFRHLPPPVPPEDTVETVEAEPHRVSDGSDDRERLLREAGGA